MVIRMPRPQAAKKCLLVACNEHTAADLAHELKFVIQEHGKPVELAHTFQDGLARLEAGKHEFDAIVCPVTVGRQNEGLAFFDRATDMGVSPKGMHLLYDDYNLHGNNPFLTETQRPPELLSAERRGATIYDTNNVKWISSLAGNVQGALAAGR